MRFALMIEPQQGLSYGDQVAVAKRAEANGFEALFRSDHYASFPGPAGKPTTDAWTVLAGLARETDRIGLGVLVSPVTFRHLGNFAKVVTTVDEMSGGRDRGRRRGRLERPRASPARAALPADQGARRPARGSARDPARAVGRAGRLVVRGPRRPRSRTRSSSRSRSTSPVGRSGPTAAPGRGSSRAVRDRRAAFGSPRAGRTSSTSPRPGPTRPAEVFARLDDACGAIGRDPGDGGPLRDGRRAHRPRRRRGPSARGGVARGVRRGCGWRRLARGTPRALDRRDAEAGAGDGPAIRPTPACERIMLQDFLPWDLDMIDVMGEALVGQV